MATFPRQRKVIIGIVHIRTNLKFFTLMNALEYADGKTRIDEIDYDNVMTGMRNKLPKELRNDCLRMMQSV